MNASTLQNNINALRFITCGSEDAGKSTLIGRLLVDTKAVLQDHLAGVQGAGVKDMALLNDGLSADREKGITIDVAYRYTTVAWMDDEPLVDTASHKTSAAVLVR